MAQSQAPTPASSDALTARLVAAVRSNRVQAVNQLLRMGADVNARSGSASDTPLHEAAAYASPLMVRALLHHGANINAPNALGQSAVYDAILEGRTANVNALVAAHCTLSLRDTAERISPVSFALSIGRIAIADELIRDGAPARGYPDMRGMTPIFYAAMVNSVRTLDLLLARGASPLEVDNRYHLTPYQWAVAARATGTARRLRPLTPARNRRRPSNYLIQMMTFDSHRRARPAVRRSRRHHGSVRAAARHTG